MPRGSLSALEYALGSRSKIAVLRILFQSRQGFSGAALARHTGVGLFAVQNTLSALESIGLVEVQRGNAEHRYRLNERHHLVSHGLKDLFESERQIQQKLAKELQKLLKGKVTCAGFFGSFARGNPKPGSDIDLFVIVDSVQDKERVGALLADVQVDITQRYGWPLQPVIFEKSRLKNKRGRIKELLEQVTRDWHHVVGLEPSKL